MTVPLDQIIADLRAGLVDYDRREMDGYEQPIDGAATCGRIRAILNALSEATSRAEQAELLSLENHNLAAVNKARAYKLAVAIMGGEDAPGYADSIATDVLVDQIRKERAEHNAWTDAAVKVAIERAEAERDAAVGAGWRDDRDEFVVWLRAWVSGRYGKVITYRTAWAAFEEFSALRRRARSQEDAS